MQLQTLDEREESVERRAAFLHEPTASLDRTCIWAQLAAKKCGRPGEVASVVVGEGERIIAKAESCPSDNRRENKREKLRDPAFVRPFSAYRRHVQSRPSCTFLLRPSSHSLFKTLSGGRPSAMNPTRSLIRSCSGLLTVQHLARRTVASSPHTQLLAVGSRRFYSEDANPSEQKGEGENKDPGPSKGESEFSKQLAAKEEEVADLKVCPFLCDRGFRD